MISKVRQERILQNGSQYYTIKPGAIAASAFTIYDIDTSSELAEARKYKPLDYIEITNNDSVDIQITLDFLDSFVVPAGVIKTISERSYRTIKITNLDTGSATTADAIILTLQRMPLTTDQYIRRFQLNRRGGLFNG